MKKFNLIQMKRYWFAFFVLIGVVFALNYWCLPAHDELAYTFQGECTPIEGAAHHVQNLMDIFHIQIADYQKGPNGRIFLHSIVCLFSGWELYALFDFVNTGMWFLLVGLVLREGGVKVNSIRTYVIGATVCFLFLWYSETCCCNSAFAINYLWSACLTIGFINLWRERDVWWMMPISFLYGWWMEVFSMPMIAALGACGLVSWLRTRKFPWTVSRCCSMMAMVLGGFGCCGSHFISGRAAESVGHGLPQLVLEMVKSYSGLVLGIWPGALILAVLAIIWLSRRRILSTYDLAPEWWMYFLFGLGVYFLLGKEGLRMGYPMLMAGTILLFRNRNLFVPFCRWTGPLVLCVTIWMTVGALIQYRIGGALAEMECIYAADSQGITYRRAVAPGLWRATVSPHLFNRWHLALFKHKFSHACEPAVLSPYLYATLYCDPGKFFSAAKQIGVNLYANPTERTYVIQKGEVPLPVSERERIADWFADARPSGWLKCLPGRMNTMFPAPDFYVAVPCPQFAFTAKDGKRYVIHTK